MIKISKKHLSLYGFTAIILFFAHNADASVSPSGKEQFSCSESELFYWCNDAKEHEISNKTYSLTGEGSDTAIKAWGKNTEIHGYNVIINGASDANDHSEKSPWTTGVKISNDGGVALFDSELKGVSIGVEIDNGAFEMRDGSIDATQLGISVADKRSFIFLENIKITTGSDGIGLFSQGNAQIQMQKGEINFINGIGVQTGGGGQVILDSIAIKGKIKQTADVNNRNQNSVFHMLQGKGIIDFQKGSVDVSDAHGIILQGNNNNTAHIKNSTVFVRSEAFNGMQFFWEFLVDEKPIIIPGKGAVHLENTTFTVQKGTAIYSKAFDSFIELSRGTELSGDLLLQAYEKSTVKIIADASILKGGAYVDKSSTADLQLKNGSKWILSQPEYEKLQDSRPIGDSSISSIHLIDSSIVFKELKAHTTNGYQTLRIGKGSGEVYKVQGKAHIYLNTYLNQGEGLQELKTDRLLIHGDVSGTTIIHVQSVPGSVKDYTREYENNKEVSIIQVSGRVDKDSFQLNGGYATLDGLPYQYNLRVYGPGPGLEKADSSRRLIEGTGDFWDFRLESQFVQPPLPRTPSVTPRPEVAEPDTPLITGHTDLKSLPPSRPPSSTSSPKVTESDTPLITEHTDLNSLPPSRPPSNTYSPKVTKSDTSLITAPTNLNNPPPSHSSSAASSPEITESDTSFIIGHTDFKSLPSSHSPSVASSPEITESDTSFIIGHTDLKSLPPSHSSSAASNPETTESDTPLIPGHTDLKSLPPSRPPSNTSSPKVTESDTPLIPGYTDLKSLPPSHSLSAASSPEVTEPETSLITELDASDKHSPVLDDVGAVSVPVAPRGDTTLSDLDYVPFISEIFLASKRSLHFEQNVRAVVPQVPTYIFLPNALLHTGWVDISNQNKQLEALRIISYRSLESDRNPALFLRGYGGNYRYASNLSALKYGYGGELDYNAIEIGTLLKNIESVYSTSFLGVMGTYGKFSLQPLNVEQSQKSTFNKWSVTVYGSTQRGSGFYIDGLLSCGLFRGSVFTLARNKTATLRGKPLSVSLTAGKAFMMGDENFILDPQIQFVYQHLRFHKTHDVDGFDIDMRKLNYSMMRIGGRLTKTFAGIEGAHAISFYGQLHFIHNFKNKQFINLGDTFLLGAPGSSLEAGFGLYAQLPQKITLHSTLTYKHKLTKAGFSGMHFSAGLGYHF
ncbi:autotransporter outer membrane beta-barrel domain-containing protein [Bartonella phoceensis]|uniref:autotransporter outer membrane beta-barrel domain-containing protein n=1 Tax=Bartonella phoceensis TaxID=270249 RepID=UPI001ABB0AB2|nr:autotransporter outer membrane beta-barrel domain-containing protein [Bartonella phoceensis]